MGILSNALKQGVIGEAIAATKGIQRTVAVVTKADEANNNCSIRFINKDGQKAEITMAQVDLKNNNWFPKEGDLVLADISDYNSAIIQEQYTENYFRDVRGKRKLENDVTPDGDGSVCGQIF